jgi:PAS domain S-box-containing protein
VELLPDAVLVHREGHIVYANETAARLVGASSPTDLIGHPTLAIVHPDDRARVAARVAALAAGGEAAPLADLRFVGLDGRAVDVEVAGVMVPFAGRPANLALVRDVSARKRGEAALRESEARRRAVVDQAAVGIVLLDVDGTVLEVNPAFERFTGYAAHELLGRHSRELSPAEDASITREIAAGTRASATVETRYLRRDGQLVWGSLTISRVDTGAGRYLLGIVEDVTERRRMAAALEREREFLSAVLDSLSEGIVACDADGRLTLFNRATCELHGRAPADMSADEWARHYDLYRADGATRMATSEVPLVRALGGEVVSGLEMVIAPRDRAARTVTATGQRFTDAGGRVLGAVVALHDITERAESDRRKSEFVSTVSHEIRTPLTSIRGSLGLLQAGVAGALPERAAGLVRIATANAERLVRLVNDVLDLEKVEAGRLDYRMAPQDPAELVRAAAEGIGGMAAAAQIEVVVDAGATRPVIGDRDRLLQVLTNLLSNAVKVSPEHSPVVVSACDVAPSAGAPAMVRFAVEDFGPGIPSEKLGLLFRKFQQLDGSDSRRHAGTGLGLAITKAMVEQHGGRVGVASEPGRRTVFWCELPAAPEGDAPHAVAT